MNKFIEVTSMHDKEKFSLSVEYIESFHRAKKDSEAKTVIFSVTDGEFRVMEDYETIKQLISEQANDR